MDYHSQKSKELLRTHFFMGKHVPEYKTAYRHSFNKPSSYSLSLDESKQSNNAHFTLGNYKNSKETETNSHYKYSSGVMSKTPTAMSHFETSRHHFVLGSALDTYSTTSRESHGETGNYKPGDYRKYLNQNQKINFTFGSENVAKLSIAKSEYKAKRIHDTRSERESIQSDHKSTHYFTGDERAHFSTSTKEEYTNKFSAYTPSQHNKNMLTLDLGGNKSYFKSTNQQNFQVKPINSIYSATNSVSAMLDSHFTLGSHKPSKLTESAEKYSFNPSRISPEIKKNSVRLGSFKNDWKTTSRTNKGSFYLVNKAENNYKGSFVVMGFDRKRHSTTTQDNYHEYKGRKPNRLDQFTYEDIRKQHYSFGSKSVDYETLNANKFVYKQPIKNRIDKGLRNKLKKVNYNFGNYRNNGISSSKIDFTGKNTERSKLMSELKRHNIVLGTYINKWSTQRIPLKTKK